MNLKLVDDFIECDKVFGPMPDFNSTFEAYFIEKAYNLLFDYSSSNNNTKYIVRYNFCCCNAIVLFKYVIK